MVWFYRKFWSCFNRSGIFLSIPLWSDFIGLKKLVDELNRIAFNPTMVWFYQCLSIRHSPPVSLLSIPLWSDFITVLRNKLRHTICAFNPTMVWFYLQACNSSSSATNKSFNPTMVWFYLKSISYSNQYTLPKTLSIPLWSDFISMQ